MSETPKTTPDYLDDDPGMVAWSPTLITVEQLRIDTGDLTRFLARLAVNGNVMSACKVAKVSRATVYRLRDDVSEFRVAWDHAIELSRDVLRREAFRRAVEGVAVKTIYAKGEKVAEVREYSDTLLIKLLQAHCSEFAKTIGGVNVQQQVAVAVATDQGPPIPDGSNPRVGNLGDFVKRLGEVAREQGLIRDDADA